VITSTDKEYRNGIYFISSRRSSNTLEGKVFCGISIREKNTSESAFGNLDMDDVPGYLHACGDPYAVYLLGFLGVLAENKRIEEWYLVRRASELNSYLNETSLLLAEQGLKTFSLAEPKYKGRNSPLALRLLSIDIRGIKDFGEKK
jgi:hypothetical protein